MPLTLAQDVETPEQEVGVAIEEVQATFSEALGGDTGAMWRLVEDYAMPLVWAIVILIATLIVGKIIAGVVTRSSNRARVDETLSRFFGKLVYYLVLIIGVMFALGKFGIEVTSFAAILAAAGFAVGMALSGTLSNFAAGTMLLVFRPFKVGQIINAAGVVGKVHEIELFTTTLDTPDNRRIIVPNAAIYGGTIENISFHAERRVDVGVGCDYTADLDTTRGVLDQAAASLAGMAVQGEDRGHQVVLGDLGDSSVNWTVRLWVKAEDYWAAKEALTRAIKVHLDEAGIGIPFPQMDVHLGQGAPS